MVYFEEIFYITCSFLFAYLLFKYDIFKSLGKNGIINKDFSECYILKYPKHAELHNKAFIYKINIEEFFKLNSKLQGKIKIIERPEVDSTKADSVREELAERKRIKLLKTLIFNIYNYNINKQNSTQIQLLKVA